VPHLGGLCTDTQILDKAGIFFTKNEESSLFCIFVSDREKSFITMSSGANVIKLFTAIIC
jgi:hypothetical protein